MFVLGSHGQWMLKLALETGSCQSASPIATCHPCPVWMSCTVTWVLLARQTPHLAHLRGPTPASSPLIYGVCGHVSSLHLLWGEEDRCVYTSRGQRTACRSQFSPSAVWVSGIELRFIRVSSRAQMEMEGSSPWLL